MENEMTTGAPIQPNKGIGEVFDELIDGYTDNMTRWVPYYPDLVKATIDSIPAGKKIQKILDLGCGNGNISVLAATRFPEPEIHLVDASAGMLEVARKRLHGKAHTFSYHINIQALEFNKPSFDLITACFSLHHLIGQEKQDIFPRMTEWLKEGGVFSYSDIFVEKDNSPIHKQMLSRWEDFVREHTEGPEDWEFLIDHYERYDWPNSTITQQKWMENAGFTSFKWEKFEGIWAHCLAERH